MGWPVVLTSSGGIPVTQSLNGLGTPVDIAANGIGTAVTLVGHGGIPVLGAATVPVNLLQHSETFDQWTASGASVNPDVAFDPVNGNLVADRFIEATGTVQHSLTDQSVNFTSGVTYTFSVYAKYETAAFIQLLLGSGAFGLNAWGNFDVQNGVLGTMGTAGIGQIANAGNGWFRCSISLLATASASSGIAIFGANSASMTRAASYAGVVTNTRLLADAQVETGAVANIYVPTA